MASESISATAKPIAEGFAEFQREKADQSIADLCGETACAAICDAPAKPEFNRPTVDIRLIAGVALLVMGLLMALTSPWRILGVVIFVVSMWLCYPALGLIARSAMERKEPNLLELLAKAESERHKQNLRGLEEYRRLIANSKIPAYVKFKDGTSRRLTAKELRSFDADHGRLLIISDRLDKWLHIKSRPVPCGEIWVDVNGRVTRSKFSAADLFRDTNPKRLAARMVWLWKQTEEHNLTAGPFVNGLKVIDAFRTTQFESTSLEERAREVKSQKGIDVDVSFITKVHSGNYENFEKILHSFPLEDMP